MRNFLAFICLISILILPNISIPRTLSQRSFAGGEITPSLYGRVGIEKYQTGLRTLRNFFVKKHGGATNRSGTEFIGETHFSEKISRLIPFIFNNDQTYMMEFGDEYIRFINAGAYVTHESQTVTALTQADPGQATITGHGYETGDWVFLSGLGGMTELNTRTVSIQKVDNNNFTIHDFDGADIDTSAFTAFTSGGGGAKIFTISTDYEAKDLFQLNFVQSADVVTIVNNSYAPAELSRTDHDKWTLADIAFVPAVSAPTFPNVTGTPGGSTTYTYHITANDPETNEESLAVVSTSVALTDPATNDHTITWDKVSNIEKYFVYLELNGVPGFVGTTEGDTFTNDGIDPDTVDTPPGQRNPFDQPEGFPGTVTYVQQRLSFGNTVSFPTKIYMSRSAQFSNFSTSSPSQDDDAVTFSIVGKQNHSIKHLLDLGRMVVFTSGGEWSILGDDADIIRPGQINPKQNSYNGSGNLPPLVVNDTAIYLQARGSIIRDFSFSVASDGYTGDDLTIFSSHLFEGFTIVDWDYQKVPDSIVWVVRSDGVLLSLTFNKSEGMLAWARHDFQGGQVESVSVIPDGNEDAVYLTIKRTINNRTTRYVEKVSSRFINEIQDAKFMDSHLSLDGRNEDTAQFMTLTGGTTWAYDETFTLAATPDFFVSTDVGKEIHLTGSDDTLIRFAISSFVNTGEVLGRPDKTVTVAMRDVSINSWNKATKNLTGLWHLEGENLSIIGDGHVAGSPNNNDYEIFTVSLGNVTLDNAASVVHAGLPYISDIETLDVNSDQQESLSDRKKKIDSVTMFVEKTRGVFAGGKPPSDDDTDPLEGLFELKIRSDENMDDPISLKTDLVKVHIRPEWNNNGRVFLRQTEPLPFTVLTIEPNGWFPFRK